VSIFSTFSIGKQGLLSHQRAIQVTSRNVANVNTPGYSRQRAIFDPIQGQFGPDGFALGGGVNVRDVQRIVDLNVEQQLQREQITFAYDETLEKGLSRIEAIFDELGDAGLSKTLDKFFSAINDLANNPASTAVRDSVVGAAQTLLSQISSADARLNQVALDANAQISRDVDEINSLARSIATTNQSIARLEIGSGTASEQRDVRAQLLQELGKKIDFTYFEREDGTIAVFAAGFLLVDGDTTAQLEVSTQQPQPLADPTYFNVYHNINGQVSGPITPRITGGSLGGNLELRDGRAPAYRELLDRFTYTLANSVNTQHLLGAGIDDGNARNFFIDRFGVGANPPGAPLTAVTGAARLIVVNPDIAANSRHIAAGAPTAGPGPAADGDNTNALALTALSTTQVAFFQVADPPGPATGAAQTFTSFLSSASGALGADLQNVRLDLQKGDLVIAELEDRRGSISGVSIDEEVTDLVRFQRGFEASARIITTVDELLQALLAI
jgi:flagellar hook-associated protein 1 FlgK